MQGPTYLPSDEEFQQLFTIAYVLHPEDDVAESVLKDSIDVADRLLKVQQNRQDRRQTRGSREYLTPLLPQPALLQVALYETSTIWECDQESPHPALSPCYQPTPVDFLTRFCKLLIYHAMPLRAAHALVTFGSCLYTYRLAELKQVAPWLTNETRLRKAILRRIEQRFPHLIITRDGHDHVLQMRSATSHEREITMKALAGLRPLTPHFNALQPTPPSAWHYLSQPPVTEKEAQQQVHALIDWTCGAGFAKIINDYNAYWRRGTNMLPHPDDKLGIPDQPGIPSLTSPHVPSTPSFLSPNRLARLKRDIEARYRCLWTFRPQRLTVFANGREQGNMELLMGRSGDCTVSVPAYTPFVQVFGHEQEERLLLAVFELPGQDDLDTEEVRHLILRHASGQSITLTIHPDRTANEIETYHLQITYTEALQARMTWVAAIQHTLGRSLAWIRERLPRGNGTPVWVGVAFAMSLLLAFTGWGLYVRELYRLAPVSPSLEKTMLRDTEGKNIPAPVTTPVSSPPEETMPQSTTGIKGVMPATALPPPEQKMKMTIQVLDKDGKVVDVDGKYAKDRQTYEAKLREESGAAVAVLHKLAELHTTFGRYDRVMEVTTTALSLNVDDPLAFRYRGLAYDKLGNRAQARRDLQRAAQLGDVEAQRLLEGWEGETRSRGGTSPHGQGR